MFRKVNDPLSGVLGSGAGVGSGAAGWRGLPARSLSCIIAVINHKFRDVSHTHNYNFAVTLFSRMLFEHVSLDMHSHYALSSEGILYFTVTYNVWKISSSPKKTSTVIIRNFSQDFYISMGFLKRLWALYHSFIARNYFHELFVF